MEQQLNALSQNLGTAAVRNCKNIRWQLQELCLECINSNTVSIAHMPKWCASKRNCINRTPQLQSTAHQKFLQQGWRAKKSSFVCAGRKHYKQVKQYEETPLYSLPRLLAVLQTVYNRICWSGHTGASKILYVVIMKKQYICWQNPPMPSLSTSEK